MNPGVVTSLSSSSTFWRFLVRNSKTPNGPRRPRGHTNHPVPPPVFPSCPQPRHAVQRKAATPPAYQTFTGQRHSFALSLHKLYSTGWTQDTKLPGVLSMSICHLWISDLFHSTVWGCWSFYLPFPMGWLFPASLPWQLPYGHASLQQEEEDVTYGTSWFCPSDAAIVCQTSPRVRLLPFPNGSNGCAKRPQSAGFRWFSCVVSACVWD